MVLTDRIMAGVYDNFFQAVKEISFNEGYFGFYNGWFPALAQKIPSYALTWMLFQQLKLVSENYILLLVIYLYYEIYYSYLFIFFQELVIH